MNDEELAAEMNNMAHRGTLPANYYQTVPDYGQPECGDEYEYLLAGIAIGMVLLYSGLYYFNKLK
tara:strand:- start:1032 stop:1226 length:195 start_codon:yes stop_codon:yes gene_type:complete